jgi:glycosyltransferase involved in cell wall biosynthesis
MVYGLVRQEKNAMRAASQTNRITENTPLVSIVINNYNYARFLPEAIDSALIQTYPHTEVIVVDDGSTDDSRQVITRYGNQILPIFKRNEGQASAFNCGFSNSQGKILIFLDADDRLQPEIVENVVKAFRTNPSAARVHYRLAVIDSSGNLQGTFVPPAYLPLATGNLQQKPSALVNGTNWSPTSGNAFAAWSLRQILPMPVPEFRTCADYYLLRANALCGPMIAFDEVGAYYRFHGNNNYLAARLDVETIREQIKLTQRTQSHIQRFEEETGRPRQFNNAVEKYDEIFLAQRFISLKLQADDHPVIGDTLPLLFRRGIYAALCRTDLSWVVKLFHVCWFVVMLFAPQRMANVVAQYLLPGARSPLNHLLQRFQSLYARTG